MKSYNTSQLTIKNRPAEILVIAAWLKKNFDENKLPLGLLQTFDLCANEAVTNIISYAYEDTAEHDITLKLVSKESSVSLEITDQGKPFNPLERAEHIQPKNLESAHIGGLGIYLIRHYMDKCCYQRKGDTNVFSFLLNKE